VHRPPCCVDRLATRTNNPYGRQPEEVAETLHFVETLEPLLPNAATLELDTTGPVDEVVRTILQHVLE